MKTGKPKKNGEAGFSLIEVTIAMVVLLVGLLGVSMTYVAAVQYNAGNNLRLQSLAILQQEVELMRSAKFSPTVTDATLLGGTRAVRIVTTADGNTFQVQTTIDDDPFTAGVQTDAGKTLKEITIRITSENQSQGWVTAIPAEVTFRRVRSN
jgi:prepilin-type N-terminal cleavage/methylation domain-containing protein